MQKKIRPGSGKSLTRGQSRRSSRDGSTETSEGTLTQRAGRALPCVCPGPSSRKDIDKGTKTDQEATEKREAKQRRGRGGACVPTLLLQLPPTPASSMLTLSTCRAGSEPPLFSWTCYTLPLMTGSISQCSPPSDVKSSLPSHSLKSPSHQ